MMDPDAIGHCTLDYGNDRPAHNRHIYATGPACG